MISWEIMLVALEDTLNSGGVEFDNWEFDFIDNVYFRWKEGKTITQKEQKKITKIYDRKFPSS